MPKKGCEDFFLRSLLHAHFKVQMFQSSSLEFPAFCTRTARWRRLRMMVARPAAKTARAMTKRGSRSPSAVFGVLSAVWVFPVEPVLEGTRTPGWAVPPLFVPFVPPLFVPVFPVLFPVLVPGVAPLFPVLPLFTGIISSIISRIITGVVPGIISGIAVVAGVVSCIISGIAARGRTTA